MINFKNIFYIAIFVCPILMFFGSSSFMLGTVFTTLLAFSLLKFEPNVLTLYYKSIIVLLVLILLNFVMMIISETNFILDRFFLSWFLVLLIITSSFHLYYKYKKITEYNLQKIIRYSYYLFLVIGVIGCSDLIALNKNYVKSMFPFSEPSHFAIYLAPILISIVKLNKAGYMYIIPFVLISFFIQNFTIMIVALLAFFCKYKLKSLFIIPLILLYVFNSNIDLGYFESRLNFGNNENLSVLVYNQGIDIIHYTIFIKNGIGMGFQQLGFNNITFATTEKLRLILERDMNLTDGGFTLAKLIGEFGFLAFIIIIFYFNYLIKSFKIIFNKNSDLKLLFSAVIVISYSIELFVRGLGYFNVSLLFLAMAILYIKLNKTLPRENRI